MTFEQSVNFIHGIARFGSKPGLRRIRRLLELLGNPQRELAFIHVAGTNGKGSTCAMLEAALREGGYKTGLYISPYVTDFRERIQLSGSMISQEDFAECASKIKPLWDELDSAGDPPSEFETLLGVAFEYYRTKKPDVMVLGVGRGGRWDATNVIDTPAVSVITSLSLDHTEYLGETIGEIAFEKCGIIKPGGITVVSPGQDPEALAVIRGRCEEEGSLLRVCGEAEVLSMDFWGTRMSYGGLSVLLPLRGMHQVRNASAVLEALSAVSGRFPLSAKAIADGIAGVKFPARLEVISKEPLIILDGAHNPDGARVLGEALELISGKKIHAVMGMLGYKDVSRALAEILPRCHSLVAVPVKSNPNGMAPEELARLGKAFIADASSAPSAEEGVRLALSRCEPGDAVLVCGSLYLAGEIRPWLLGHSYSSNRL
ncbi:MAG: bifunctional folylpolyglutamate synthase/dihydrofolate synthase [Oscillospiraceae bacterium]|nr:bifunctional folylpolyglutamate synthase/dihydrofolate synthase [Oscillospiraceae bacterium]